MNKLYVIGIGPGDAASMTVQAHEALQDSEVIAGYGAYVDLVRPLFPEKEYLVTPMRQEIERCRLAIDSALHGKTTAMISSGDAGVYGMASPILELSAGRPLEIVIVPGVTAALSGASLLGAPLGHDFAVISLSDLLTPWEVIERRLRSAAQADFAIAIYNPASPKRKDYLQRACDILLETLSPDTVCGIAKSVGREGEEARVMTLRELRDYPADMFTTAFIGSFRTQEIDGRMVTPRGYRDV